MSLPAALARYRLFRRSGFSWLQAAWLAVALVLAIAAPAAAKNAKLYIFVAPQGPAGFAVVSEDLKECARDLLDGIHEIRGITATSKRDGADILVEITARELVDGQYRVHAQVTTPEGVTDLVGASAGHLGSKFFTWSPPFEPGWYEATREIAKQVATWAHAHPEPSPHQKALIDAGVK
jgi:hypothetical protein